MMAILKALPSGGEYRSYKLDELPPKGTFAATCIDCMESMDVTRKKYQSEEEETVDLLRYLFVINTDEGAFLIQSNEMKISAFEKATLAKFIQSWTGDLPTPGFDTMDLVGECCTIGVNHKTSQRGTTYPIITSIGPLLDPKTAPDAGLLEIPGGSRSGIDIVSSETGAEEEDGTEATDEKDPF